jgi:hypothetical protein
VRKSVLLAAVALLALSLPAYAQRTGATSTSGASNSTNVGTSSGASARTGASTASTGASNSSVTVYSGSTASDPSGSANGGSTLNYSGTYSVKNTPELIPPSIVGGNPCSIGVSGGVSLPGFGIAGGATWADSGCERRQQAALLFNMGKTNAAVQLMCQDDNVRTALKIAGEPCVLDLAKSASTTAPAAFAAPLLLTATPAAPATRPDWCAKARPDTEASKVYVAEVCK